VRILPSSQTAQVGQTFTVDVVVEGAVNLGAFTFRVSYNGGLLQKGNPVTGRSSAAQAVQPSASRRTRARSARSSTTA
jgi:hypothetical protein